MDNLQKGAAWIRDGKTPTDLIGYRPGEILSCHLHSGYAYGPNPKTLD